MFHASYFTDVISKETKSLKNKLLLGMVGPMQIFRFLKFLFGVQNSFAINRN